jgi:hypothetical protein
VPRGCFPRSHWEGTAFSGTSRAGAGSIKRVSRSVLAVSALLIVAWLGQSQARPEFEVAEVAPRFEVATIKRSAPGSDTFMQAHGGQLDISRATLKTLTAFAYRLQSFQVSGDLHSFVQNTSASLQKGRTANLMKIACF